ncbi:hypothetical protein LSAT2_026780, partial [Lamellibrachia satsuma]
MTESANATLSDLILTSIAQSASYWKTVDGVQLVAASVAVIGNTLVGINLLTNRQLRENTNNIMMTNLAMANGLVASALFLTGYWNTIAGLYPFGELACRFHIVFAVSSSQASSNILAAKSVVKFIRVGFPFASDQMLQLTVIRTLVVAVTVHLEHRSRHLPKLSFNINCTVNVLIYFYTEPRFRKAAFLLVY